MTEYRFEFVKALTDRYLFFIEPRRELLSRGIIDKINYSVDDLSAIALNIIRAGFRNSVSNQAPIHIQGLGTFTIVDQEILFLEEDGLLRQISGREPISQPPWVNALGREAEQLDDPLILKILAFSIRPLMDEDPPTIATVAFSSWTEAVAWFLARNRPVILRGIGEFRSDPKPRVVYNPDPLLSDTLRLSHRTHPGQPATRFEVIRGPKSPPSPEQGVEGEWTDFFHHLISGIELTKEDQESFRQFVKKLNELKNTPML